MAPNSKYNIKEASLGRLAVSGKFRRLKLNSVRPEVDPDIIDDMATKLTEWSIYCEIKSEHFQRTSIKTIALSVVQFCLYWFSDVHLDSRQMHFLLRFLLWTWFMDDALEEAWLNGRFHKGNIQRLRYVHKTFLKIIRNQTIQGVIPELSELPEFQAICKCAQGVVQMGIKIAGDGYEKAIEPLAEDLQTNLQCNEWLTLSRVDERYNLRTHRDWGLLPAGSGYVMEASAIPDRVRIPSEIRNNPAFLRMVDIIMSNTTRVKGDLGSKTDFEFKEVDFDDKVLFRVLCKNNPIEVAVRDCEELRDLDLINQARVDMINEEESISRYFDKINIFIHGHGQNKIYAKNVRNRMEGFVQ